MYMPVTAKPARPMIVAIAAVIMGLMALLHLLGTVVSFAAMNSAAETFRELAGREDLRTEDIDTGVAALRTGLVGSAILQILMALLLAGLAWGVIRGSQPARVTTWIVCGLGVLCACCTGFTSIATFSSGSTASTDPNQVVGGVMIQSVPAWASGILGGSSALNLLGYIATAVLLALPAANAFFKGGNNPGWQPPSYSHPPSSPYPPPPPPPPPPPS